jgi:hypothetical protein
MNPNQGFDAPRPPALIEGTAPETRQAPRTQESSLHVKQVPAEALKPAFQIQPGSEVYVQRSNGEIEGEWIAGPEDPQTGMVRVTKVDGSGNTLAKHIDRRELDELNRPTTLKDIRGVGQQSIDSLVRVVKKLQEGGITDANGFVSSEDVARLIISAWFGELPLNKITSAGYLRPVLEHLMRLRQIRGELGQTALMGKFEANEDRKVSQVEAGERVKGQMPRQGEWVTVKREDGQLEGNWVMMQPDEKTGTVMLLQIKDNLPWAEKTVSFAKLREWNS